MRVLVTGASGFVGKILVLELIRRGYKVFAGSRKTNIDFDGPVKNVCLDLLDLCQIRKNFEEIKPDGIIHLAAQSKVNVSWKDPANSFLVNTVGTINLINAVKQISPNTKVITVGSSEEYGLTGKTGELLTEEHPLLPQNPYAVSKFAAGQVGLQLARKDNLKIIHVRPFNHFGPGQQEGYVISDFASQIACIEQRQAAPVIKVGDLSAKRDFTDVRDVVEAYISLLEKNVPTGIYNVCSGIPRAIDEILDFFIRQARLPIEIQIDQERFRPSDVPLFIGSCRKIQQATGWQPKRKFWDSLQETLEWWRRQLKQE